MANRFAVLASIVTAGLMWQATMAQAACTSERLAGDSLSVRCSTAEGGSPALGSDRIIDVATAGTSGIPGMQQVRFNAPAGRTNLRYICTPSGFGQIARCTLR